jgi:hypothetical protein
MAQKPKKNMTQKQTIDFTDDIQVHALLVKLYPHGCPLTGIIAYMHM